MRFFKCCGLHWLTWGVLLIVGGVLVRPQVNEHFAGYFCGGGTGGCQLSGTGWPFRHQLRTESWHLLIPDFSPQDWKAPLRSQTTMYRHEYQHDLEIRWSTAAVALNGLVCTWIVGATVYVVEAWLRRPRRWQFSIGQAFMWVAVLAAYLSLTENRWKNVCSQLGLQCTEVADEHLPYYEAAQIVSKFGIVLATYATISVVVLAAIRLYTGYRAKEQ